MDEVLPRLPAVDGVEARAARGVDEHAVDVAERVVPGGARRLPVRRQLLVALEDLLDEHVGRVGRAREVVEVAARIEQAVGMVDPDAVDEPLAHPAHDLDVRLLEHPGQLDADRGERVHGEEAAVVELGIRPRQSTSS